MDNDYFCRIKYGSWIYNGNQLNLTSDGFGWDLSIYEIRSDYRLTASDEKTTTLFYDCCPEPYVSVTYSLNITKIRNNWWEMKD